MACGQIVDDSITEPHVRLCQRIGGCSLVGRYVDDSSHVCPCPECRWWNAWDAAMRGPLSTEFLVDVTIGTKKKLRTFESITKAAALCADYAVAEWEKRRDEDNADQGAG